jgi:hypothetical protein
VLTITLDQILRESLLRKKNGKTARGGLIPFKVGDEEPIDGNHKINLVLVCQLLLEMFLHFRILRKINEIIDIETYVERFGGGRDCFGISLGGFRLFLIPHVEAWIMWARGKTDFCKNIGNHFVPVTRATSEAVQCLLQFPVLVWNGFGVPNRGHNDCQCVGKEGCINKSVFTVALFQKTTLLDGQAGWETKRGILQNRCEAFVFHPRMLLKITEGHDTRFSAIGIKVLIFLDNEDGHSRDGFCGSLFLIFIIF